MLLGDFMRQNDKLELRGLTEKIIGAAIEVHRNLGPGLLESAYEACLAYELEEAGLTVERQKTVPLVYKDIHLDLGFRLDLVVDDQVVLELKAVDEITDIDEAEINTFLELSDYEVGLLINFNVRRLKDGIRRFIRSNR
jgi:GxxExxY protein